MNIQDLARAETVCDVSLAPVLVIDVVLILLTVPGEAGEVHW